LGAVGGFSAAEVVAVNVERTMHVKRNFMIASPSVDVSDPHVAPANLDPVSGVSRKTGKTGWWPRSFLATTVRRSVFDRPCIEPLPFALLFEFLNAIHGASKFLAML
jgi:hypothetical protein